MKRKKLEEQAIKELVDIIWSQYDRKKTGFLDQSHFRFFMIEMTSHKSGIIPEDSMQSEFAILDQDRDGLITKNDMIMYIKT